MDALKLYANDLADVNIKKSQKHTQAVLNVTEKARTVTKVNKPYISVYDRIGDTYRDPKSLKRYLERHSASY